MEMAALDLKAFAAVDSGFFVYKKRASINPDESRKPDVYVPWGVFEKNLSDLQALIDDSILDLHKLVPRMERWVLVEDLPEELRAKWSHYGVLELGIWPLVSREKMIGAIVVAETMPSSIPLTFGMRLAILDACAALVSLGIDLILASRIAEESSQRDLLTGLLNRRGLDSRLPKLLQQASENRKHIVFGLIDLDDLKVINDTNGHPAGDQALQLIAEIINRNVRSDDLVARIGGDEFAVVMQTDKPDSEFGMLRLQKAVKEQSGYLSASVGGAVWGIDGDLLDQCYQVADERLYENKRLNRR